VSGKVEGVGGGLGLDRKGGGRSFSVSRLGSVRDSVLEEGGWNGSGGGEGIVEAGEAGWVEGDVGDAAAVGVFRFEGATLVVGSRSVSFAVSNGRGFSICF